MFILLKVSNKNSALFFEMFIKNISCSTKYSKYLLPGEDNLKVL